MRIIHVIPLSRGIFRDTLTYFSAKEIPTGALVTISVRNKHIPALVVDSESVNEVKANLRQSSFPIKKIRSVKTLNLLRPEFVAAARRLSEWSGAPLGPVLRSILPRIILESAADLNISSLKPDRELPPPLLIEQIQALQDSDEERISFYKGLIRETFAQNGSVFLCVPTREDVDPILEQLERGISQYTFVFHGGLSKKEIVENWQKASSLTHPVLIIGSPTFLSLPRRDIQVIIVDKEQANSYKQQTRPFIDLRTFAEMLSKAYRAKLFFGDISLRLETLYRTENKEIVAANPLKQRFTSTANPRLIHGKGAQALNEELYDILRQTIADRKRSLVIANRRGIAPLVVCNDCGNPVLCERCDTPVGLHQTIIKGDELTHFVCHRCGKKRSSKETCKTCGSWKLHELGTGVEKVVTEIETSLPGSVVLRLDSDSVKTSKQAHAVIEKYLAIPHAILVATEMALYYLRELIPTVLIVAIDSTLALPDFRTNERLFNLLLRLRSLAKENFVIQTRHEQESIFDHVTRGNNIGFYREEIITRRTFDYPPFSLLIKVSRDGEREEVKTDMNKLGRLLKTYAPTIYPSFRPTSKALYRLNALIKMEPGSWPDQTLTEVLKNLPPSYIVNVDPADIL